VVSDVDAIKADRRTKATISPVPSAPVASISQDSGVERRIVAPIT
jgi:hypothetical protein